MNKLIILMLLSGIYLLVESLGWVPKSDVGLTPERVSRNISSISTPEVPIVVESWVGKVSKVEGESFVVKGDEKFVIFEGMTLNEGDVIITSNKSFLTLEMNDKTKINLGGDSKVKLTKYPALKSEDEEVNLDLSQGSMRTDIVQEIENGYFRIKTPDGEISAKKAELINITKNGFTKTIAIDGFLDVVRFEDDQFYPIKGQEKILISDVNLDEEPILMDDNEFDYYRNKFLKETDPSNRISQVVNKVVEIATPILSLDPHLNENSLTFDEAMAQIEILPQSELEKAIRSPMVSVAQKEILLDASTIQDKTSLIELVKDVVKQTEYQAVIETLSDPVAVAALTIEEKEELIDQVASTTAEKAQDFLEDEVAAVLITPDNKVVFFEDHPELKDALPTDDAGEIIGIKVDENLNPIETVTTVDATEETMTQVVDTEIPVVGPTGELIMMPVLNEASQELVIAPTDVTGEVAGVNTSILEAVLDTVKEVVAPVVPTLAETTQDLVPEVVQPVAPVVTQSPVVTVPAETSTPVVVKPMREVQAVVTKNGVIIKGDDTSGKTSFSDIATDITIIQTNGKRK